VPAETIHELARLIANTKPSWLWCNWGVSRKSRGEETAKGFAALQAILGYWGTPGAGPPLHFGPQRNFPPPPQWGEQDGDYCPPKMYRAHYWSQAILLLDKVKRNELSEKDYMRQIGWKADRAFIKDFNPQMALLNKGFFAHASDFIGTATDSARDQVKALEKMEFTVGMHSMMTKTMKYADIIFPVRDPAWEQRDFDWSNSGYGGFQCINFCPGVVNPPGEVRHWVWIYVKIAEKLGIDPKRYFKYYTSDENWEKDWEKYLIDHYQGIINYYKQRNINVPSWKEFTNGKFINCDELDDKPYTGWDDQIKENKPFPTESGKIEFYSKYVANAANKGRGEHYDSSGRIYETLPNDWDDYSPMPIYKPMVKGMNDPLVKKYPLLLLTPHARYRVHYVFFNHPWLKDHIYRHRVWISSTDAKVRDIKDDDNVVVYNDQGKIIISAYITSRIMPGIVVIHHGGWYNPDKSGADLGGAPSTLLGGDKKSNTTTAKTTTLVQIEKYEM
jgi:anaerobic dimethyl sulfoxide reductase subunit A